MEIIKELLQNFTGGPEAIAVIILALGALWIFGHYFIVFCKWIWDEVYPKLKEKNNSIEQLNYNKIFEDNLKEKIIILVEEHLKELKNYNKIFNEHYKDNVENMILNLNKEKDQEITKRVFEIYEKITELREKYAGRMATREDIQKLSDEIKNIEKEISSLKEKVNKR
jgi:hypothetical protein